MTAFRKAGTSPASRTSTVSLILAASWLAANSVKVIAAISPGEMTRGEHHRDAPCHERCLSGSRSRLHQQNGGEVRHCSGNGCPDRRASCRGAPEPVELLVSRAEFRGFATKIALAIRWKRKTHVIIEGVLFPTGRDPSATQNYRRRREVFGGGSDRVIEFVPLELEGCRLIRQCKSDAPPLFLPQATAPVLQLP